jgi:hypothetical protein
MAFVIDPNTGLLVSEEQLEKNKKSQPNQKAIQQNVDDSNKLLYGETTLTPDAEDNQEHSSITAAVAGIASGLIKVPEGIVSLGAELIDLGFDTNTAASVEQFFDKINPFEEIAEQKALGKITQALVQIGLPAGVGAKVATKLATKALKAKRAGKYLNLKSTNLKKGAEKAAKLNELSTKQKFAAITLGGAAGETTVADVEDLGTIGDAFEAGPTELDRNVESDSSEDASRKLLNRIKFGSESIVLTPLIYGAGTGIKSLATRGKQLAYSNKKLERFFDTVGSYFRPRGSRPQELFRAQRTETGRTMADTNFAMEQVKRIDQEVDKMFPEVKSFLNKTTEDTRGQFLKEVNDLMFAGDLKKEMPQDAIKAFSKTATKFNAKKENIDNIIISVAKVRNKFSDLMDITAEGPAGMVPAGTKQKLQTDLRQLMGDRVKQYIGTTYRIFQNQNFGFYSRYKATEESMQKAKNLFKRYAAKNNNPITDEESEMLVENILDQARRYNPKSKLPTFTYDNLSAGASDAENIKTFARTLTKELPDGTKEIKVIGKGSKIFRELFGEIEDARYSIFEGINRLGTIARKNQLFDDILNADEALKAAATKETAPGSRGFFFSSSLDARRALPNQEIVKIDPYVQEYFRDGVLVNRLQGMYTTKDIAEAFGNASRVSQWMRGEAGNKFTKTMSAAYRNLYLTPKAGSQYAKTILSVPTHFRNFLSSSAFVLANGGLTSPAALYRGIKKAKDSVQLGIRDPKAMEYYRELLELGVVNSNVRMGDLTNLMRDAKVFESGNVATDSILKPMINSLGKVGQAAKRTVRKTANVMQDAYVAEDDFWKIAMYETELARRTANYAKAGIKKTEQELKEEAARIIRNTIPNYAYVGDFVRAMRATPFGNFMSWPSEVFRTGYGIARQAIDDIKDPITGSVNYFKSTNPNKSAGLARIVGGVTAFGALPYGIIEGTKAIYGVSDEEAKAVRESAAAPWSKNSQLIVVKDPETGEYSYSDWSNNNVYDTLTRPFTTLLRNVQNGIDNEEVLIKGFVDGLTQAAGETASPFVGESIFTEAINDVIFRDGRTKDGYQLWTENTPDNEKWSRAFKHVVETQAPQYKQLYNVYNSATGKPDPNGDVVEIDDALAGVFGFKLIPVKPDKALGFHINDYQKGIRESRREFSGGPEGVMKPMKTADDLIERYFVSNKALFKNNQQMYRHIENLKSLGLSPGLMSRTFDERGLKKDYRQLTSNVFDAYYPSKNTRDAIAKIARDSGQPNPFIEAQGIISAMYNAFRRQRLSDEFNLKLEDFLPQSTTAPEQSALPLQPMPNQQIVQSPQMSTGMGLTPTEMSLLSPEEKQLRLRQRGLA